MGVDIVTWQLRIAQKGNYGSYKTRCGLCSVMRINGSTQGCTSLRACTALSLLLFMAGIELNPGPVTCTELAGLINNLTTQVNIGFQQCNAKLDAFVAEVTELKASFAVLELKCHNEIAALKTSLEKVTKELADVKSSGVAPQHIAATPPPTLPSAPALVKVVREIDLQASKKTNIVLSGIAPSLLTDADIVTNLLRDELGITANVTKCSRLGKPRADGDCDTRPRLLLVTLSSADTANDVIRVATRLRRSTNNHTRDNVFINRDLTPEQRAFDYELRQELKRRRAMGEANLVIRNGKVCEKLTRPTAAAAAVR